MTRQSLTYRWINSLLRYSNAFGKDRDRDKKCSTLTFRFRGCFYVYRHTEMKFSSTVNPINTEVAVPGKVTQCEILFSIGFHLDFGILWTKICLAIHEITAYRVRG